MPLVDTDRWWRNPRGPRTRRVRAESEIFSFGSHVLGEELAVRWSAERQQFREFSQANAPEDEWRQFVNGQGPASAPAPEPRVVTHTVNLVNASGVGSETALAQLQELHAQGVISDEQLSEIRKTL